MFSGENCKIYWQLYTQVTFHMEFCEVADGDNLVKISVREGVSVSTLKKLNRLWGNEIFPGQILRLKAPISDFKIQEEKAVKALAPNQHFEIPGITESHDKMFPESTGSSLDADFSLEPAPRCLESAELPFSMPSLIGNGRILQPEHVRQLSRRIPESLRTDDWKLLYSLLDNGADLTTFFKCVRRYQYSLLIIVTVDNEIFGGFVSGEWKVSPSFCKFMIISFTFSDDDSHSPDGRGESFIFKVEEDGNLAVYGWTRANDFFVWSTDRNIAMGGGGEGFGFVLDGDFETGESCSCDTYGNPPLTARSAGFQITNVECWGFAHS